MNKNNIATIVNKSNPREGLINRICQIGNKVSL